MILLGLIREMAYVVNADMVPMQSKYTHPVASRLCLENGVHPVSSLVEKPMAKLTNAKLTTPEKTAIVHIMRTKNSGTGLNPVIS